MNPLTNKKKILNCVILFLILNLFNSCLITMEPYRKTRIFDLGYVETCELSLKIEAIENPNLYRHQFIYRLSENEIEKDDYNRWTALPENMLYSRLKTVFKQDTISPILNAKILKFELNKMSRSASLKIIYSIKNSDGTLNFLETFNREKQIDDFSPELFAVAMTDLTNQFIEELKDKIRNLKK